MHWDRVLNDNDMRNPSGLWDYTGKEMTFSKVNGEENTYSVEIKLKYAYKTTGKGAKEGCKNTQASQTINMGIKIKKEDQFTYRSDKLK